MRKLRIVLIILLTAALLLSTTSGQFLVINDPKHADAIVVLAGETDRRPALGLELLSKQYAPIMVLDVPVSAKIYDRNMLELPRYYVQKLPPAKSIILSPIPGLS